MKHAVLPLAPSGLAAASRLCSDDAAVVQRGKGGSGVEQPLGGSWR
jgi:hypothetical protein